MLPISGFGAVLCRFLLKLFYRRIKYFSDFIVKRKKISIFAVGKEERII
jgi:hypothetical protein